jgi:hypothetical protein
MSEHLDRNDLPAPPWAERLVRFLDDGLRVPGTRFRVGFDGLIGLLFPGAGDAVTAVSALSLFWLALQRGVPRPVLFRMAINVGLDALIGAIPVLGDLFDFGFKSNRKNLRLIERAVGQPERPRQLADYLVITLFALVILSVIALPILLAFVLYNVLTRS